MNKTKFLIDGIHPHWENIYKELNENGIKNLTELPMSVFKQIEDGMKNKNGRTINGDSHMDKHWLANTTVGDMLDYSQQNIDGYNQESWTYLERKHQKNLPKDFVVDSSNIKDQFKDYTVGDMLNQSIDLGYNISDNNVRYNRDQLVPKHIPRNIEAEKKMYQDGIDSSTKTITGRAINGDSAADMEWLSNMTVGDMLEYSNNNIDGYNKKSLTPLEAKRGVTGDYVIDSSNLNKQFAGLTVGDMLDHSIEKHGFIDEGLDRLSKDDLTSSVAPRNIEAEKKIYQEAHNASEQLKFDRQNNIDIKKDEQRLNNNNSIWEEHKKKLENDKINLEQAERNKEINRQVRINNSNNLANEIANEKERLNNNNKIWEDYQSKLERDKQAVFDLEEQRAARREVRKEAIDKKTQVKNVVNTTESIDQQITKNQSKLTKTLKKNGIGLGINAAVSVSTYNQLRDEGDSVLKAGIKAGGDFVLGEVLGMWTPFYYLAKSAPKLAVSAIEGTQSITRNMNNVGRTQVFGESYFQDTQQLATMRQAGMEMAKMSQYNLQQSIMGNEAQHMHRI